MLEMPYKGDDLAMVLIVPQSPDGLPAVERLLTPADVRSWIDKLEKRVVSVFMPRFKVETGYKMNAALKALGMTRAFVDPAGPNSTLAANGAEFDGICAGSGPAERLFVDAVVHKAYLEVNETGTEAAAATCIITAGAGEPNFTPTFRADKPFLFLIRDKHTGCILFLGRMVNPKE